jgi:hypothetical protein
MSLLAHNLNLNLSTLDIALQRGTVQRNELECTCHMRLFAGGLERENGGGLPVNRIGGKWTERNVPAYVSPLYPASCPVTASGSIRRPSARRSSAFAVSIEILFGESTENISTNPPKMQSLALGSRTLSLGFAQCDPSKIGNSKTETRSCT